MGMTLQIRNENAAVRTLSRTRQRIDFVSDRGTGMVYITPARCSKQCRTGPLDRRALGVTPTMKLARSDYDVHCDRFSARARQVDR